jgi:hypothetical protein
LTLFYCGKAGLGHFLRSFSLNGMTIRLKKAQKLSQAGLSLATNGQARQAASAALGEYCRHKKTGASPVFVTQAA